MSRHSLQTGRKSFSRETITKRRVCDNCSWCGQHRTDPRTHAAYVYVYHVTPDSGRELDIPGSFCSVGCLRDYYR